MIDRRTLSPKLRFSCLMLLLVLQRTPLAKPAALIRGLLNPAIQFVKATILPATGLALPHALSGASDGEEDVPFYTVNGPNRLLTAVPPPNSDGVPTRWILNVNDDNNPNFISIELGNTFNGIDYWTFSGELPQGLSVTFLNGSEIAAGQQAFTQRLFLRGTLEQAGLWRIELLPWEQLSGPDRASPVPLEFTITSSVTPAPTELPKLNLTADADQIEFTWTGSAPGSYVLRQSSDLTPTSWTPVPGTPSISGDTATQTQPLPSDAPRFYELVPADTAQ